MPRESIETRLMEIQDKLEYIEKVMDLMSYLSLEAYGKIIKMLVKLVYAYPEKEKLRPKLKYPIVVFVKTNEGLQIVKDDYELLAMLLINKDAEVHRLHYRGDLGKFDDEVLSRDQALDELNSGVSLVYG